MNEPFESYYQRWVKVQSLVDGAPMMDALVIKLVEGCNPKFREEMKMKKFHSFGEVVEYAKRIEKYDEEDRIRREEAAYYAKNKPYDKVAPPRTYQTKQTYVKKDEKVEAATTDAVPRRSISPWTESLSQIS